MSQFRQFWIYLNPIVSELDVVTSKPFASLPDLKQVHVVEIAALEAAQREIAALKDSNENIRNHLLSQTKMSNELLDEKEKLTAALKVAEDAIRATLCQKVKGYPTWQEWENICVKNKDARLEIQIIKKELGCLS